MANMDKKRTAHYVLSTHWDREWYQSFQDFRYRLVHLVDGLLAGWADGRLKGPFQTDGQAIILEDYLEIRPERRDKIEELARTGRLVIGPFYVLPDEFIISGESLVRNLELGHRVARSFGGKPSRAGFLCDMFGHNSQMPQILKGFGIRGGFIWRGTNLVHENQLRWIGADGTELPCFRFGTIGYCDYAAAVRSSSRPDRPFNAQKGHEVLTQFLERETARTPMGPLLIFDGCDHMEWDPDSYKLIMEEGEQPDAKLAVRHSSLDAYLDELEPLVASISATLQGELRQSGQHPSGTDEQWVIPGVLSSRVWIKQDNSACQTLLCQWAEPLASLDWLATGRAYPQSYLDVAWRWLIQNHPHDSICGCSIDVVHEDMKYRFSQTRQIGERLTTEAVQHLAACIQTETREDSLRVVVFNPLPQPLHQTVELTLQIPKDWPAFNELFGYEPKPAFRIFTAADGVEIPYQRLGQAMDRAKKRVYPNGFPQAYRTHDVHVSLPLDIPALGYTTLSVRRGEEGRPTRHPQRPGMATSECSMSNGILLVEIESDGSLTLTDLRNGQRYTRLLTFEDCADIGDGWFHGQAVNDQVFTSTGANSAVALVHDGPMLTTFRIRTRMEVPAEFIADGMARSERFTELVIDSLVSLRPEKDRLEIETKVTNRAGDHRLRVLFPSGVEQASTYLSDTPFDVVERPVELSPENHLYREPEVETHPQQSWTAVFDEQQRGLAVVAAGLLETAVRDIPERTIALTLLRATRRTVMTDGEPNGQLAGDWTFRYWVTPFSGLPKRASLCTLGQELAAGIREVQLRPVDVRLFGDGGKSLPVNGSLLWFDGPAVLSSLRKVDETLEVRLYNPDVDTAEVSVTIGDSIGKFKQVQHVRLDGEPLGPLQPLTGGKTVQFLAPKQILTLRFIQ